ncbi:hypothetical protein Tco_1491261 [Tanacetum coccineum]
MAPAAPQGSQSTHSGKERELHSPRPRTATRQMVTRDQAKKSKKLNMGHRGRTSTFLIRITNDDNDNLGNYPTKGDSITDVYLTLASKLADIVLRIRVLRQKEEAQKEKIMPGHCVKRDTSLARPWRQKCFYAVGERKRDVHSRLGPEDAPRHRRVSRNRSTSRSAETPSQRRKDARELIRSYVTCSSKRQQEIEEEWNTADRTSRRLHTRTEERYYSENDHDQSGHWKSKKNRSNDEEDLS